MHAVMKSRSSHVQLLIEMTTSPVTLAKEIVVLPDVCVPCENKVYMYMRYYNTEHMLRLASTLLRSVAVQSRISSWGGRGNGGGGGGGGGAHLGRVGAGVGESSPIESFSCREFRIMNMKNFIRSDTL